MTDFPTSSGAHNDGVNQQYSILGVQGTLGTTDTKGTAYTLPISVDPASGAIYSESLGGTIDSITNLAGGTLTRLVTGSIVVTAGTIGRVTTGSIVATNGSIGGKGANAAATVGLPVLVAGMDAGGTAYTLKTDTSGYLGVNVQGTVPISGTISAPSNPTGGTIDYIGNIGTMPAISMGDISGGTIDIITGGSIVVTAGTVTTTMGDLSGGTIDILTDGTISKVGTIPGIGVVGNINGGSIVVTAGTVTTTMGDLSGGTIDVLTTGSIVVTNGTIASSGTVTGVGVIGNVNGGSIVMTAGTIGQITPGTAASHLGKQVHTASGTTDVGVAALGVRVSSDVHDGAVDGEYSRFALTDFRELKTRDQRAIDLANCNVPGDYTAISNDTTGIAGTLNHVFGTAALTYNKVNGAANTVYGGVSKALGTINVAEIFESGGFVGMSIYIPSLSNVVNAFLRIGTDSSNYNCWTWPVANLTAATWLNLRQPASTPDYARNLGNGWDPTALVYVAFGVEFSNETNTLSGIISDHVHLVGGRVTATDISTAVTTTINNPNVNVQKIGNNIVTTGNGIVDSGVQRVSIASDSTGTLAGVGVIGAVTTGTIVNSGTTTGVGTVTGVGVIGALTTGSIVVTAGTITTGTIVNSGTTTGVGTVSGIGTVTGCGTIGGIGVLAALTTGTLANSGTTTGVGVVGNVNGGSIVVTAGTVASVGTIPGVGIIGNVNTGSIVVTAGTIASVGTTPGVGVVGTVTGMGTVTRLGTLTSLVNGTLSAVGTATGVGVVGNVNSGSIVVTAGTIASSGTVTGVGVVGNVNGGSIVVTAGTVASVGTVPGVGVIGNVNGGSIVITNGTIASSGTVTGVGVVGNLNGGTLGILTNGTVATNILPLGGVVKTTAVVCGTAATALPASALSSRKSLVCYNIGTITCYIGDGTVSTTSGIPVGTSQYSPGIDLGTTILYGVSSAASGGTLVVLEVS